MFASIGMTSLYSMAVPTLASSSFDMALTSVRNLVVEISGNQAAAQAPATAEFTDFMGSDLLPTVLTGLANAVGEDADTLRGKKIMTFGQAAQYILDRS